MPQAGIHPMRHLVRHVFADGSSVFGRMVWQRPYGGLEVTTKFHDYSPGDYPDDSKANQKAVGQRARFENRFHRPESNSTTDQHNVKK